MYYSKFTGNTQRRIRLKRVVRRTIHNIEKIAAFTSMWGSLRLAPIIIIIIVMSRRKRDTESLVHSKFHPSRPCSACVLCGKTSAYYTHLAVWKEEERAFLYHHYDGELADDSGVCRADYLDIKRHHLITILNGEKKIIHVNYHSTVHIDWDAPDLQERVKGTIQFLTKGCTCKHGCKTRRCSCKKNSKHCGPGCECQGCVNLDMKTRHSSPSDTSNSDSNDTENDTENESELRLECEVITNTIEEFIDWT